jgi:WhiB family redox-sensing transcriptional regulator
LTATIVELRPGLTWRALAACKDADPNVFFPADGPGVEIARAICAECLVRLDCLDYALSSHQDHGVWGGTSERERKRIIKNRRRSIV